jgi:hypothetical protein
MLQKWMNRICVIHNLDCLNQNGDVMSVHEADLGEK